MNSQDHPTSLLGKESNVSSTGTLIYKNSWEGIEIKSDSVEAAKSLIDGLSKLPKTSLKSLIESSMPIETLRSIVGEQAQVDGRVKIVESRKGIQIILTTSNVESTDNTTLLDLYTITQTPPVTTNRLNQKAMEIQTLLAVYKMCYRDESKKDLFCLVKDKLDRSFTDLETLRGDLSVLNIGALKQSEVWFFYLFTEKPETKDDINTLSVGGTPLYTLLDMADEECLDLVQYLFKNGAQIHVGRVLSDVVEETNLHIAARRGFRKVVEFFLQNVNPDIVNKRNQDGYSALHIAAKEGYTDIFQNIYCHPGANIEYPPENSDVDSLLSWVVNERIDDFEAQDRISVYILKDRIRKNIEICKFNSLIYAAVRNGLAETVEKLFQTNHDETFVYKDSILFKELVDQLFFDYYTEFRIKVGDYSSKMPPSYLEEYCAEIRQKEINDKKHEYLKRILYFLIDQGLDCQQKFRKEKKGVVNVNSFSLFPNYYECNLLHLAAFEGDYKLVDILLKRGLNPTEPDSQGELSVDLAKTCKMESNSLKIIELLNDAPDLSTYYVY